MPSSEIIDASIAHELGMELLGEMLELFASDVPAMLDKLRALHGQGKLPELSFEAHGLKGVAASLGAVALASLCATLEDTSRKGSHPGLGALIDDIERSYHESNAALEEMLERGRGSSG